MQISNCGKNESSNYTRISLKLKLFGHIEDSRAKQAETTYPGRIRIRECGEYILVVARCIRVPVCPRCGLVVIGDGDDVVAVSFHRRRRTAVVAHRFGYATFPSDDGGDGGGGGGGGDGGALLASTVLAVAAAHDSVATRPSRWHTRHDAPYSRQLPRNRRANCITAFIRNRVNTAARTFGSTLATPFSIWRLACDRPVRAIAASTTV